MPSLTFNNFPIQQVPSTKFLGLEIDSNLNWKNHIAKVENKIASVIGVLRKIRYKLSNEAALTIYDSLIMPHILYCNIVWASNYKSSLHKLYNLQKRALCICLYFKKGQKTVSACPFAISNRLNVYQINMYCAGVFMYSYQNCVLPKAFENFFPNIVKNYVYNTRNKN